MRAIIAGLRSIRRTPLQQSLAIGSIAVAVTLLCLLRLASEDLLRVAEGWGRGVQMTVYLEDSVAPARVRQIADILGRLPGVERVETIEPREAFARLKRSLGDRADLLDGVEETMLPTSIEVGLKPSMAEAIRIDPAFERLRHTAGVEDVELMGDWVRRVNAMVEVARTSGVVLAILLGAGCLYGVASTIRLGVLGRREEIEILKLVGATDGFVRAPFLVEGIVQGALGGGIAIGIVYALHRLSAPWIEHTLGSTLCASPLGFLRPSDAAIAVGGAMLIGLAGSAFAVERHVRS